MNNPLSRVAVVDAGRRGETRLERDGTTGHVILPIQANETEPGRMLASQEAFQPLSSPIEIFWHLDA